MLIYESNMKHLIEYKNLAIRFNPCNHTVQDDYVLFGDEEVYLDLLNLGKSENWQDYDSFDVQSIKKPVIVLHK